VRHQPEDIILAADAGGTGGARAQVVERTFLGNINEYYVKLASGDMLRVQTHPKQQFKVGETVSVAVDAANVSVFARTAHEAA
jgi:ABC-type Fe3+/spermidine/putrescine transport system ATPase subunit